jgi:hypothetical protein
VPHLIEQGVLQGKTVRGKTRVLADDALEHVLQLGIEPLIYGQQGWSFVAVEAPIDRVAEVVRDVVDVVDFRPRVKVHRNQMGSGTPEVLRAQDRRAVMLDERPRRRAFMSSNPDAIERVDFIGIDESAKIKGGPKRPKEPAIKLDETVTGEDALRRLAEAMGVPTRKKKQPKKKPPTKRKPK